MLLNNTCYLLLAPPEITQAVIEEDIIGTDHSRFVSCLHDEDISIKIADVREWQKNLAYAQDPQRRSYFIILHADKMTLAAQNAALKLLEEPPNNTTIILVSHTASNIIPTIQSRCILIDRLLTSSINTNSSESQKTELTTFFTSIKNKNYGELILLSDSYQTLASAIELLTKCLIFMHQKIEYDINSKISGSEYKNNYQKDQKCLAEIQKTLIFLQRNVNLKLALENCFFEIKRIYS